MDIGPPQVKPGAVYAAESGVATTSPAVGRSPPVFVHGVYRRLTMAPGLSAGKRDLRLLGGDTVKTVV